MHSVPSRATRLATAAITAAIVGSLAVAGCSKLNLKHEADAAQANLRSARSASFTLHVSDPRGELGAASKKRSARLASSASVVLTIDPSGDRRLGDLATRSTTTDPGAALKASGAFDLTYRNGARAVFDLRSVSGVLYLRIDPAQYQAVTGTPLGLSSLPEQGAAPGQGPVAAGIAAGKWLSLDLSAALARAKASGVPLAAAGGASDPRGAQALGRAVVDAVQAHTSYRSRSDGGTTTVDVRVHARDALAAVLAVLDDPQYAKLLGVGGSRSTTSLSGAKAALARMPAGDLTGTVTLSMGHVRQVALNLASLAALSKDRARTISSARLIVDVNDRAPGVSAPAIAQVVPVDALLGAALGLRVPAVPLVPSGN